MVREYILVLFKVSEKNNLIFSPLSIMVIVGFHRYSLSGWRSSLLSLVCWVFLSEMFWISSNTFFLTRVDQVGFIFILLTWCVVLTYFWMFNQLCIPRIKTTWSWYIILYFWKIVMLDIEFLVHRFFSSHLPSIGRIFFSTVFCPPLFLKICLLLILLGFSNRWWILSLLIYLLPLLIRYFSWSLTFRVFIMVCLYVYIFVFNCTWSLLRFLDV